MDAQQILAYISDPFSDVDTLTPAERNVAIMGAHGWSTSEIADQLEIAQATVLRHSMRAHAKIGIGKDETPRMLIRNVIEMLKEMV